ncbi:hypothetical protein ACFV3R_06040 [Streptomyces sp. NPDC059740]|uniref:hypothetical protein n=1 Tax=Streptomyces sp. NPDC059740 TaxID=3346926 RepID=UPI0036609879
MAATPDDGLSASEAARALQDVDLRRGQARDAATDPLWVNLVFGLAIFVLCAAPDFFGEGVSDWVSPAFAVLAVGYVAMIRTRRGSALLGRPTRVRRQELSGRVTRWLLLALLVVVAAGVLLQFLRPGWGLHVPYGRTVLGLVLGSALIVFGRRWQRALLSLATRTDGDRGGMRGSVSGGAH